MMNKLRIASILIGSVALAAPAFGTSIGGLETADPTGTATPGSTIGNTTAGDPPAIINFIESQPGSVDGYTYTNWAFLTNDGTGSLDIFGHLPAVNTEPTPTVGDAISATGTYSLFDGFPELSSLTALSNVSSGNAVASPTVVTIPQLIAVGANPNYSGIQEFVLSLNNVWIEQQNATNTVPGNFPTHANGTYTLYGGGNYDAAHTMEMFQWASSYSTAAAFGGTPVPTGLVDMTGFVSIFGGNAQFTPFTITAAPVPEPVSTGLMAVGCVAMLMRRR